MKIRNIRVKVKENEVKDTKGKERKNIQKNFKNKKFHHIKLKKDF